MKARTCLPTILIALGVALFQRVGFAQETLQLLVSKDCAVDGLFIETFMTGPFGGVASDLHGSTGQTSYDIALHPSRTRSGVKDGRANTLRIIAYCPAHQIVTLEFLDLSRVIPDSLNLTFEKLPIRRTKCHVNFPADIQPRSFELVAYYMASSAHSFYGIIDGPVTQFEVLRIAVPSKGHFELALPNFSLDRFTADQSARDPIRNSLRFVARDPVTWNSLFELVPREVAAEKPLPDNFSLGITPSP
jgi:hypothetical protein